MDQVKPQKSQFWIWTTLWLTAILDSALIFFVFFVALIGVAQVIKAPVFLFALTLVARILALWLGAYVAVRYVLKKTIVFKRDADKFAFLAIVIPFLGSIVSIAFPTFDFQNLAGNLIGAILVLGITWYSVRNLIIRYGSMPGQAESGDANNQFLSQEKLPKWIILSFAVIVIGAVVYFAVGKKSEPVNGPVVNNNSNNTHPANQTIPSSETVNWKAYTDNKIGLSFEYPSAWTDKHDKSPNLLIYSSLISSLSNECGDGLVTCQQDELNNKKIIENGSTSGIFSFDGGRGSLIATCAGNEGGDLVPTPLYEFKFYKGDRLYEITVNDLSVKLNANSDCHGDKYIQDVVKSIPNPILDTKYKTYNDLLILIKQTLVLK